MIIISRWKGSPLVNEFAVLLSHEVATSEGLELSQDNA